jgi:hypothetical protein
MLLGRKYMNRLLPHTLYHYTKREHAESLIEGGVVSFGYSGDFDEDHLTVAQRDQEHIRSASFTGKEVRLRTGKSYQESVEIPNIRSVDMTARLPPYFLKCMSIYRDDRRFFAEFTADTCVCIRNPAEFLSRLTTAINEGQLLLDWDLIADYAVYRRENEPLPTNEDRLFFLKKKEKEWQKEFRVILVPRIRYTIPRKGHREQLVVGPIDDICSIL